MPVGKDNFSDVQGHWAENSIKALMATELSLAMQTRAEIVAMLSQVQRRTGLIKVMSHFSDMQGNFAENAINEFAQMGIISGMGDGKFDPNANATREQAVVMILRMLNIDLNLGLSL
jgi:endo-1,4-beta-xylanase